MRKTARQLKDMIRNLPKENSADAQILMRNYMMDMDATIKGANVSIKGAEKLIDAVVSVPIDDGVTFQVKRI